MNMFKKNKGLVLKIKTIFIRDTYLYNLFLKDILD